MNKSGIYDLYNRFVLPDLMDKKLVIVDDTDPGIETTDHVDSPWMCEAMNEKFLQDQYMEDGKIITVPFSKHGPTLLIHWICLAPTVNIREGVGIEVVMPFGRLATLYYDDNGKLVMKTYFAR